VMDNDEKTNGGSVTEKQGGKRQRVDDHRRYARNLIKVK
jgi:hypothetical protein